MERLRKLEQRNSDRFLLKTNEQAKESKGSTPSTTSTNLQLTITSFLVT